MLDRRPVGLRHLVTCNRQGDVSRLVIDDSYSAAHQRAGLRRLLNTPRPLLLANIHELDHFFGQKVHDLRRILWSPDPRTDRFRKLNRV